MHAVIQPPKTIFHDFEHAQRTLERIKQDDPEWLYELEQTRWGNRPAWVIFVSDEDGFIIGTL